MNEVMDKMPRGWYAALDRIDIMNTIGKPRQLNSMFSFAQMNNGRYASDVLIDAVKQLQGHQELKKRARYCYVQNNVLLYFMGPLGHVQCEDMADLICCCMDNDRTWTGVQLIPLFETDLSVNYDVHCDFYNPDPGEEEEENDYVIIHRTKNKELADLIFQFVSILHDEIKTIPA
jgi:hypothetical protein